MHLSSRVLAAGPSRPPPPPRPRPRGPPSAPQVPLEPPAPARPSPPGSKSLFASYRSLSPNTRIAFGLAVGLVGIAGLYWDSLTPEPPTSANERPLISVRTVDR